MALEMNAHPGTYALLLQADRQRTVRVWAAGARLTVEPGCYVYVGSALGPGGVRARVGHHSRLATRPHWHIDYLRRAATLRDVWYSYDSVRREHAWADIFRTHAGRIDSPSRLWRVRLHMSGPSVFLFASTQAGQLSTQTSGCSSESWSSGSGECERNSASCLTSPD